MSPLDDLPPDATHAQRLVARMAGGDEEALRSLYDTHGARILRFLHALTGDRQAAEDLTQETFLAAWRAAPGYRPRAPVEHWLYTIARRLGWRHGRRRRRAAETARGFAAKTDRRTTPAPEDRLAREDEAARLRSALTALPPRLRLVFVLVRIAGCTYAEAAHVAGLPVGTVKSRMSVAERRLRAQLTPRPPPPPRDPTTR